jgi:AT-hook transcription factor
MASSTSNDIPSKPRGRPRKYNTEQERKVAAQEYNRQARARKKDENNNTTVRVALYHQFNQLIT